MRNAYGFVKKKNYASNTPVSRVVESGEPMEFKALFLNWVEKDTTLNINKTTPGKKIHYLFIFCYSSSFFLILNQAHLHKCL